MTIQKGFEAYRAQLPNLLPQHEGKWALIINDGNLLVCDSEEEATRIGFQTFGKINEFMVYKIEASNLE